MATFCEGFNSQQVTVMLAVAAMPPSPAQIMLSQNVVGLVKARGMTPAELADGLGMSRPWASMVLRGERMVTLKHWKPIAAFLKVPQEQLLPYDSLGTSEIPTLVTKSRDTTAPAPLKKGGMRGAKASHTREDELTISLSRHRAIMAAVSNMAKDAIEIMQIALGGDEAAAVAKIESLRSGHRGGHDQRPARPAKKKA